MAEILREAGLRIYVGRYSIRVEDCSHFVFQEYGGDLGDPVIDAAAESAEDLLRPPVGCRHRPRTLHLHADGLGLAGLSLMGWSGKRD